ncbi:MAG: autotransporter-associated beta strand repeat-containing protein, partial [Chthoniobacterales bacterium]
GTLNQLGAGTTTLSATNTYSGDTTISAGVLRLAGENAAGSGRIIQTALDSLVEFLGGGRMTNDMTVFQYSFANSLETAGQVTLADTASSIAVFADQAVTGSGSFVGAGGLTKLGAGTLALTAGNSFSGPLSVVAGTLQLDSVSGAAAGSVTSVSVGSGATLLVSQSNQVNSGASVTLSGGTIRTASGVSEVFGNLSVTGSGLLDFGTTSYANANTISFGTYTTTPSALLTINNFNFGSTMTFGANLSSDDLATFSFTNGGIASSSWDEGAGTFTITAIPEPSTYVAAIGLLALMLWPLRRWLRGKVS